MPVYMPIGGGGGGIGGGASTMGNTAGSTGTVTTGNIVFVGSNALTLSQSTGAAGSNATISFIVPATSSLSATGQVSISTNGSTISIGAAAFSGGMSTNGNTSGNTGLVTGRLALIGGNNITLSGSTNGGSMSLTISGANAGGAQTGISGIVASDATYTSGTVSFSNQNGVTIGSSVNGATQYVRLSVAAQSNQSLGIYNSSQTTGASSSSTHDARSLSIAYSGNISGGWTNGSLLLNVTTAAQSAQTIGGYASSNTTGESSSSSFDARSFSVRAIGGISAGYSAGMLVLSAGAAGGFSAGVSNIGDTSGNTGVTGSRLVLAGNNNITLSQATDANGATVTISGATVAGAPLNVSAGTTSGNIGSVVFSNSNGVSFGLNGSTVTGSVPGTSSLSATGAVSISTNGVTISIGVPNAVNFYASSNTFGTSSGTGDYRTISIAGAGAVSVAASNSGYVISAPQAATLSEYDPFGSAGFVTNSALGHNSIYFVPVDIPSPVSAYRVNWFASVATLVSATNKTQNAGYTFSACLYSRPTNSVSQLNSFWSGSYFVGMTGSSNSRFQYSHPARIANSTSVSISTTSFADANASTYLSNSIGGFRAIPMPVSLTLTAGRYWMAVGYSTAAATAASFSVGQSLIMQTAGVLGTFRPFGSSSAASDASYYGFIPGLGTYSVTSGAFPATVALSTADIRLSSPAVLPYWNISGFTTATNLP